MANVNADQRLPSASDDALAIHTMTRSKWGDVLRRGSTMQRVTLRCGFIILFLGTIEFLFVQDSDRTAYSQTVADITLKPAAVDEPIRESEGVFVAQGSTRAASPLLLQHGDGKADGRKSLGGSGEVIQFALPSGQERVKAIKIHGSRYGYPKPPKEDFDITFLNEEMTKVLHRESAPYSLFKRGDAKWVVVRLKKPLDVTPVFWVVLDFKAEQTKGVYVSYDTSTEGKFSRIGLPPDGEVRDTDFNGDWMVQALITKSVDAADR